MILYCSTQSGKVGKLLMEDRNNSFVYKIVYMASKHHRCMVSCCEYLALVNISPSQRNLARPKSSKNVLMESI